MAGGKGFSTRWQIRRTTDDFSNIIRGIISTFRETENFINSYVPTLNEDGLTLALTDVTVAGSAALGAPTGKVGFYSTTPIVRQTGVAVSAAGVHAALVNLGLITGP